MPEPHEFVELEPVVRNLTPIAEFTDAMKRFRWCWDCGSDLADCEQARPDRKCCPDCRHRDTMPGAREEWAVFWGADDPNKAGWWPGKAGTVIDSDLLERDDEQDARHFARGIGARVARRTITRTPWVEAASTEAVTQETP